MRITVELWTQEIKITSNSNKPISEATEAWGTLQEWDTLVASYTVCASDPLAWGYCKSWEEKKLKAVAALQRMVQQKLADFPFWEPISWVKAGGKS